MNNLVYLKLLFIFYIMEENSNYSRITILYDDENILEPLEKISSIFTGLHKYNKGITQEAENFM
jgi:hypothetical protein